MAKVETFSDAIEEMMKNVDKVCKEVAQKVSEKMADDIEKKTEEIVDKYYEYKNGSYTKHERTYQLYEFYNIAAPKVSKSGNGYIARGKVTFDPDLLEYYSNSSKHQGNGSWKSGGDVESDYVYESLFFEGKHPWYSGAPVNDGSYELRPGGYNIKKAYQQFDDTYDDKYLTDYFNSIVVKAMQQYF
jgi:hypothetical protein